MEEKRTLTLVKTAQPEVEKQAETETDRTKVNVEKLREELKKEKALKSQKKAEKAIETPNYDFIKEISPEKRKKIYKIEQTAAEPASKPSVFSKKLKLILFGLVFLVAGAFCLSSGLGLLDASNTLSASQAQYELNLENLIKKISKTDSGNKLLDLIETYPDEFSPPSSIAEDTNWFDKICNFISGIFGG